MSGGVEVRDAEPVCTSARFIEGVQRYAAAATVCKGDSAEEADKGWHLEKVDDATGDAAVNVFAVVALAKEVDGDGNLWSAASHYRAAAEAIPKARYPGPGEVSKEQDEFLAAREELLDRLGVRLAAVRTAQISLRDRSAGRFRPSAARLRASRAPVRAR